MKRSTEPDGSINKELAFYQLDGVPGFCYRAGRTKHSYSWVPIVASPIVNRTRVKDKN